MIRSGVRRTKLFFAHSEHLLSGSEIDTRYLTGQAQTIRSMNTRGRHFWRVETENGTLDTRILILAPGARERPEIPGWADRMSGCSHVFDPDFDFPDLSRKPRIAVVGGGMSAHQLVLGLSESKTCGNITLIRRQPSPIHAYDADPGFLGVKRGVHFTSISDYNERRKLIVSARWPGSVPRDLSEALEIARKRGLVKILTTNVVSAVQAGSFDSVSGQPAGVLLRLDDGESRLFDRILLATGFRNDLPHRKWLSSLAESESLKLHTDGYPIPTASLEWKRGLFVGGGLAELETGPSCLNIIGAHKAYEKMRSGISEELHNTVQ